MHPPVHAVAVTPFVRSDPEFEARVKELKEKALALQNQGQPESQVEQTLLQGPIINHLSVSQPPPVVAEHLPLSSTGDVIEPEDMDDADLMASLQNALGQFEEESPSESRRGPNDSETPGITWSAPNSMESAAKPCMEGIKLSSGMAGLKTITHHAQLDSHNATSVEMGNMPSSDVDGDTARAWSEKLMACLSHENSMEDEPISEDVSMVEAPGDAVCMTLADSEDMQWYRKARSDPEEQAQSETAEAFAGAEEEEEEEEDDEDYDPFNTVPVAT